MGPQVNASRRRIFWQSVIGLVLTALVMFGCGAAAGALSLWVFVAEPKLGSQITTVEGLLSERSEMERTLTEQQAIEAQTRKSVEALEDRYLALERQLPVQFYYGIYSLCRYTAELPVSDCQKFTLKAIIEDFYGQSATPDDGWQPLEQRLLAPDVDGSG